MEKSTSNCVDCKKQVCKKSTRCKSCDRRKRNLDRSNKNTCVDCGKYIKHAHVRCQECYIKTVHKEPPKCKFCSKQLVKTRSVQCYNCYLLHVITSPEYLEKKSKISGAVSKKAWAKDNNRKIVQSKKMKELWSEPEFRSRMIHSIATSKLWHTSKLQNKFEEELFTYNFIKNMQKLR